jgi:GNAT superfamily N-acetyltransferase
MFAGDCRNPAYLANVCVAAAAQRQGIGRRLIETALSLSHAWGAR